MLSPAGGGGGGGGLIACCVVIGREKAVVLGCFPATTKGRRSISGLAGASERLVPRPGLTSRGRCTRCGTSLPLHLLEDGQPTYVPMPGAAPANNDLSTTDAVARVRPHYRPPTARSTGSSWKMAERN